MRLTLLLATLGLSVAFAPTRVLRPLRSDSGKLGATPGTWDLELFSPAKINLFLRVVGRRPDGFHDLASLFQTIDLGDQLAFSLLPPSAEADVLTCSLEDLPMDGSNLVSRALDLFRARTGQTRYFRCFLDKRTPMQAGLGGGSSNAATALHAANQLCGAPATNKQLIEWSGELGSDITFFLGLTGSAYCTGRGEIIDPVTALPPTDLFVIKPAAGLSTPLVFKTLAASEYSSCSDANPEELLRTFIEPTPTPADMYINDLEAPAFECLPELATIKESLLQKYGFPVARMSGSGTSIFAIGEPSACSASEFPGQFSAEMADAGIEVQVWQSRFLERAGDENQWYADP